MLVGQGPSLLAKQDDVVPFLIAPLHLARDIVPTSNTQIAAKYRHSFAAPARHLPPAPLTCSLARSCASSQRFSACSIAMQALRLTGCQAPVAAGGRHAPAASRRQERRAVRPAQPALPQLPGRHAQRLLPCRAMSDSEGEEEGLEVETAARQAAAPADARQQQEQQQGEAAAAVSSTTGAPAARQQARDAVAVPPPVAEPDMGQAWKMGLGGVVALAAFAGLGFLGHRLSKTKAVTEAVSNVQQVRGCRAGRAALPCLPAASLPAFCTAPLCSCCCGWGWGWGWGCCSGGGGCWLLWECAAAAAAAAAVCSGSDGTNSVIHRCTPLA